MTRNNSELLNKVYCAQWDNSYPGDFLELIKVDFVTIEETISKTEIKQMGRQQYNFFVKKKINGAALNQFKVIQEQHSKVRGIQYSKGGSYSSTQLDY